MPERRGSVGSRPGCLSWPMTYTVAAAGPPRIWRGAASSLMGRSDYGNVGRFMKGNGVRVCANTGMTAMWMYDLGQRRFQRAFVRGGSPRTARRCSSTRCPRRNWRNAARGTADDGTATSANRSGPCMTIARRCTGSPHTACCDGGGREPRSLDIAGMMITQPWLGMCMLREDDKVLGMGALPDMRYRRVVDYIKELARGGGSGLCACARRRRGDGVGRGTRSRVRGGRYALCV